MKIKVILNRNLLRVAVMMLGLGSLAPVYGAPLKLQVRDGAGKPLASVMVSVASEGQTPRFTPDEHGYPIERTEYSVLTERTGFTNERGFLQLEVEPGAYSVKARLLGFEDSIVSGLKPSIKEVVIMLRAIEDQAEKVLGYPANAWLGSLRWNQPSDYIQFKLQCAFCHQQGNLMTRAPRDTATWKTHIERMIRYGSRLPTRLQKELPDHLVKEWTRLQDHPEQIVAPPNPSDRLKGVSIQEWKIGDGFSQTHDMLVSQERDLYVCDNIQDRLYRLIGAAKKNQGSLKVKVYRIPHLPEDQNGGMIRSRLKEFPKHDSTSNLHSLAESKKDGHLFFTPSAQRRIIEFDPKTEAFKIHQMSEGLYPHTIRIDAQDRVWFTLALSNQVGMLDRTTGTFRFFNLPARSMRERLTISLMPQLFRIMSWGIPVSNLLPIDEISTGVPLPYGIEVSPDQKIWFTRLYSQEIGVIDPTIADPAAAVRMIRTPWVGPRRLRTDQRGHLWISFYGESKIGRYLPQEDRFEGFDLPVNPIGSDTPYALAVDVPRDRVWVNGNQSDSVFVFEVASQKWLQIPLPRRTTFTRDIDFDLEGNAYTSNSNFPGWHVEGGQPTTIRIDLAQGVLK